MEDKISIIKLTGLPDIFVGLLLILSLIFVLAPYFPGKDFGPIKIPMFTPSAQKRLKIIGPIIFLGLVTLFLPLINPHSSGTSSVKPDSDKVIILVANFDGPDPQQYRVTEHIIEQLKAATKKYSDIEIQPLADTITVQQGGSEIARDIGTKRKASIVLWGWYAANADASSVHTYFEVLQASECLCLNQNIEKQTATISELRGFKIQTKLSGEMAYLTLLTVGLARYESGDYDGAIDRFTTAINQSDVPDQMVSPADIYLYRGNAHYSKAGVTGIDNAIANYDHAIKLKPDLVNAYYNRAVTYKRKGERERAITDLNHVLQITNDSEMRQDTQQRLQELGVN